MLGTDASLDELATYDYELPSHLIASQPAEQRDAARLLVLNRATQSILHARVKDLPALLRHGDRLVVNDTRVLPARLFGSREQTGGKWEGLYLETIPSGEWLLMSQTRGKLRPGELISVESVHASTAIAPLKLRLCRKLEDGNWLVRPLSDETAEALLPRYGTMPLPPYMDRKVAQSSDWERYQTTYGTRLGSVAAPTAGLHFTPELLDRSHRAGIESSRVTLHVGIGTFRPITANRLSEHRMHAEWCQVADTTAAEIAATRKNGGRIVAVGTTSLRTLESASQSGSIAEWNGETRLFVRPGFQFQTVDVLLTNFHLPKSSLLVLVSAFATREFIRRAYEVAVRENYRFFSYGDAMLIL